MDKRATRQSLFCYLCEVLKLEIQKVSVDKINPAQYNPRKDLQPGDPEYEKLKRSIHEFGYVEPLIWNQRTGNLVGGHQRYKILLERDIQEVECSVVDLDENREKALNIALNKISGDWDLPRLKDLLEEIDTSDLDVELTGFDVDEIDDLMASVLESKEVQEDNFDVDAAIEEVDESITQPGDIWILGKHRLICGDATIFSDAEKLMEGQLADMVFTDPPYNVNYEGGTKKKLKIKNDNMKSEDFYHFLYDAFANYYAVTKAGGPIYVCHADSEGISFRSALLETGWDLKQCLIWVKHQLILGRQDYQWKHEPILYGWKPGAAHSWHGDRKQSTSIEDVAPLTIQKDKGKTYLTFTTNEKTVMLEVPKFKIIHASSEDNSTVWRFDKPTRNGDHPTMKPISLCAKAVRNSSPVNGLVLDFFGGSGSTLMACEQLGRRCYTMELDPIYCDVIVRRWEEFTGKKAVRQHGQTNEINARVESTDS
jgi:DNA modification methylase